MALHGQILDSEGPLSQETHYLRLQSSGGCGVSSGDLCVARVGDEGDQFIPVQIHESDASRTCEDSGRWEGEAVVESTFTRTLEDSAVFGGSGSEENWMAEGDAAG